jgi:uncharacterized OsmC-like protein
MRSNWRVKLGVALLGVILTAGCVETFLLGLGASAALGSYKWMEGTMEKDYPRPMQDCFNAALAACKTMDLKVTGQQYTPTDSRIEATMKDGTSAKIQLLARPNQITTVKVRFGFMGNVDYSAYFHRLVMKNLGIGDTP